MAMATLPEILAGQGESLVGTAIAVDCDGGRQLTVGVVQKLGIWKPPTG